MTESTSLVAITTTMHFSSYKIRTGDETTCAFFPLDGTLSITEVKDLFSEKQTSKLVLKCEGISIYVGRKRHWMSSCFADLDEHRLLWMWDKPTQERIVIGKVPEFSDPVDALNKMEALLHELAKKKGTPNA